MIDPADVRGFATLAEQLEDVRHFSENPLQRVRTGMPSIDIITEGPAAGEIFTFLGRSFSGKSQVATNIMANNPTLPMIFFSLEMPARQAISRLYATYNRIDHQAVFNQMSKGSLPDFFETLAEHVPRQIIVDKDLTLADMAAYIEQYETYFETRPVAVIIDYLELIMGGDGDGNWKTEYTAKALKSWSRENEVAVFLLHQTNRTEPVWEPPTEDSARGAGYAQPVWEPILTPTGWTTMGKLNTGDEVVGSDGKPTRVTGTYPLGRMPIYKVRFRDGGFTYATAEHLWSVSSGNRRWRYETLRTYELDTRKGGDAVPVVAPVKGAYGDLPIPPYALGAILGDGSFDERQSRTLLWDFTGEVVTNIRSGRRGLVVNGGQSEKCCYSIPGLLPAVRELGLANKKSRHKFVPERYLRASVKQRLALLRGLMDTDGTTSDTRTSYATNSHQLRDAVVELVRSLGGLARVAARKGGAWDVYLYDLPFNPFGIPSKASKYAPSTNNYPRRVTSIEADGSAEVQCISVAAGDGLYVTRDYVLTHNTESDVVVGLWTPDRNPKLEAYDAASLRGQVHFNVLKNRITGRTTYKPLVYKLGDDLRLTDLSEIVARRESTYG